ncbi:MAG: hypothetical protein D4S01_04245 [Dehalococcoidia bacterium]|nr:MAG: hypothetical protein D4S01_04245 [Dehalococcoidia bacterium]
MTETTEETTEETTLVTTVVPPVEPSRESTKTTYTCNHCGSAVVPEDHDTPTGKVYRCPKCGKFMKLETPEQIKEKREEAREPLPPPEIMLTDRVKELLAENLPKVYGIPKKEATKTITAILDTLNPEAAGDPWNLHNHVKNFAPNADDRHLESIIKKVFGQLEAEGYVKTGRGHRPSYRERRGVEGYRPSYSRGSGRRDDYEEDYEDGDYPTRRRRPTRMKVVVDGQEIETDYEGYLAHKTWKREQAEETRRQEEHGLRMKRIEAEILKITGETVGSKTPQGPFEEVKEFIDEKGNFCDPEKAVSVRIKTIPMETKALTLEDVRKVMREGKEELTPEKVREIIRDAKPGESEEIKTLKNEISESRKSIEALKGTIETKEKQTLLDKIGGLEKRVSDIATTGTGEWKSDEIRLIKGGITDIKDLVKTYLEGERPLARAERILTGPAGAAPPSEMAGEAERGGVIKELRKHGLVTIIRERGR